MPPSTRPAFVDEDQKQPETRSRRSAERLPDKLDFAEIIQPVVQYELYNAGDEPVQQEVDGDMYVVPASHQYATVLRNGHYVRYTKPGVLPILSTAILPARNIVEFLVGPDGRSGKLGMRGIRPLFGDPERDKLVMEEAYTAYVDAKRNDCINLTRAHELRVATATANKEPSPRPSRKTMQAYNWLAENDAAASLRYSCPVCNWGMQYEEELHVHVVTHHKAHPAAIRSREFLDMNEGGGVDFEAELEQVPANAKPLPRGLQGAAQVLGVAGKTEVGPAPAQRREGTKVKGGQAPEPELGPAAVHKGTTNPEPDSDK